LRKTRTNGDRVQAGVAAHGGQEIVAARAAETSRELKEANVQLARLYDKTK
jgi:hypothetical protein